MTTLLQPLATRPPAAQPIATRAAPWRAAVLLVAAAVLLTGMSTSRTGEVGFAPSQRARVIDPLIDWDAAKLIAVQDAGRYKTLDSFARERMAALLGREHLPGLSPMASLLEWLFNREAYVDTPVILVKDLGVRRHLAAAPGDGERTFITEAARLRILKDKTMTPRELSDPLVRQRIEQLEPQAIMVTAMRRIREAEVTAFSIDRMLNIVPPPGGDEVDPWYPIQQLAANTAPVLESAGEISRREIMEKVGTPVPGYTPEQAWTLLKPWIDLREAWLGRARGPDGAIQTLAPADSARIIAERLRELTQRLPEFASAGVYPKPSQLRAEARYYAQGKFVWGTWIYLLGVLISIWAVVTRWRFPAVASLVLLVIALAVHGYGVGLRWYILDRIPVANMFEALTASAFAGVVIGLIAELALRVRVFALSSHALGFFSLLLAGFVLPGGGTITTIMGILDDLMLRIHTTLIITSYALIFLASIIGVVYLCGFYLRPRASSSRAALRGADAPPLLGAGFAGGAVGTAALERPLLAGAMPGDERRRDIPAWLNELDWCHLIILNIVFVILFIGIILGAVWADYSWGRPWGWDPKEVFAMNTWIIYAILIHTRFVVANRGLWTAWLSIAGCIMMAFNWWVVNFFIVGLHSYA